MHALTSAILIYEQDRTTSLVQSAPIVVRHSASIDKAGVHLGPPSVVTNSFLTQIARLQGDATMSLLHRRIIAISNNHDQVAWYRDAAPATLYFQTDDAAVNAHSGKRIPLPRLIFRASRQATGWSLAVAATGDNKPLHRQTALGFAPLYNVFGDGRVCLGSTTPTPAETSLEDLPDLIERHFFSSAFTHTSHNRIHAYKGSYAELLTAARTAKTFTAAWVASMHQRLGDFLTVH